MGTWTARQLAELHGTGAPLALGHVALRSKSALVLEALAGAATGGRLDAARARDAILSDEAFPIEKPQAAAALALAWAGLADGPGSTRAGARLYLRLMADFGPKSLISVHQQALAQALFLTREFDETADVLPLLTKIPAVIRTYLEADLASPTVTGDGATESWLDLMSALQVDAGLEPLQLESFGDGVDDPFDRLTSQGTSNSTGGELVSVVVPCFRPDLGLLTSLRSLAVQTWEDMEIVVVDDGSGPDFDEWFERAVAVDARVQVLREPSNGGSYKARNAGVRASRGSIITFQDADDWSHPRRIERQVERLDGGRHVATRSAAVRARPDLTHQWFGYSPIRPNASSLLLRRDVLERLGPFLQIRKGADSEYLERIAARSGELVDLSEPLAVTRLREGSLSRGDFTYQWTAPDRLDFRGSYRAWHRRLAVNSASDGRDPSRSPLTVPTTFEVGAPTGREVDVVWVADFSSSIKHGRLRDMTLVVTAGAASGVRQGLWHLESPFRPRKVRREMDDTWRDLIHAEAELFPVCRTDLCRATLVVVADPSVMLVWGDAATFVSTDDVEIWLTPESLEPDATGLPIDLLWVRDQCRRWWGVAPRWVVAPHLSEDDRHRLDELAPSLEIGQSRVPVERAAAEDPA